jgi:sugar/nucleoside kinase (ribokinase family)
MLPPPSHPFGAIFYGLVTATVFAISPVLVRRFSRPIFRVLVWLGKNLLPARIRPLLRRNADIITPTWRSVGGIHRPSLEYRLQQLRDKSNPAFAIVGGVYLDIRLQPVDVNLLEEGEFSVLDSIGMDAGGSAAWVGRFLYNMDKSRRSYLFTRLGDDAFTKDLKQRLEKERWIKKLYEVAQKHSQCGVSIHLVQPDGRPVTTLTHRGSLDSLGWRQIIDPLARETKRGGLIYISGYFRTHLYQDLRDALEALPARTVICIDHGRFRPFDYQRAGDALKSVFSSGLIDVYLCNYPELRDFAGGAGLKVTEQMSVADVIGLSERAGILPAVTVVRGEPNASSAIAHIAHHGRIERIELNDNAPSPKGRLGSENAFNAGFIRELACGLTESGIDVALNESVRCGLESWTSTMRAQ